MATQEPNFTELIERAQSAGTDIASPFQPAAGRVAFQPGQAPGVPAFDYTAKCDVFTLPADSGEYEDVLNMLLSGEAVARYEEKTFTKDGEFMVAICYLVPRPQRPEAAPQGDAGDQEPIGQHGRLA